MVWHAFKSPPVYKHNSNYQYLQILLVKIDLRAAIRGFLETSTITYHGTVDWDLSVLSAALQISESAVQEYFTDGRRISFLLERRLATEVFHGRIADSEKAGYDLIDKRGNKFEVRCVTRSGVYFSPSYMVGSGRTFEERGFLKKLASVHGYVLCDIIKFPKIPCWAITSDYISELYKKGKLGKRCKLYRSTALQMLNSPDELLT